MHRILFVVLFLLGGCAAVESVPTPEPAPDPMVKIDKVLLGEQVTGPAGLVVVTPPTAGVRDLIRCPDALPSEGKAVAGKYVEWKWEKDGTTVSMSQYTAVYKDVLGRKALDEARAVSSCHVRNPNEGERQTYYQQSPPFTKRFVDDRFSFCELPTGWDDESCTVLLAKGDVVSVITSKRTQPVQGLGAPTVMDFVPALTDQLFA